MSVLLVLIGCLNLLDGVFTYLGLTFGLITEANPLMHYVWSFQPEVFLSIKWLLTLAVFLLALSFRPKKRKVFWEYSFVLLAGLYTGVFFLHLVWISQVVV